MFGTHLPSEDVTVVDQSRGEALDGVLGQLGQLLPQEERGLRVGLGHLDGIRGLRVRGLSGRGAGGWGGCRGGS